MNFVRVWLLGYKSPVRFARALNGKPAPQWGLLAQVIRSLMDALLLYLPVALLGRNPPTPPYLTVISVEKYYWTLIWLTPLVFLTEWLLGAAVIHVFLRLRKLPSNMDDILNVTGLASLVIGTVLILWDWIWFFAGGVDQYFLGITHLMIDMWWFAIVVIGLKELLGIPVRIGIFCSLLAFIAAMPLSILVMRAPF